LRFADPTLLVILYHIWYSDLMLMSWVVEFVNAAARKEVMSLPLDLQARFAQFVSVIEGAGLERLAGNHAKHLEGKLWELRMKGKDGIARSIYVTRHPRRVVILYSFVKKSQKTPEAALEIARKREKEVQ
jgi:phage-related protein